MLSFVFRATVHISQMKVRTLKHLYFLYLISLPDKLTFFGIRHEEILMFCNFLVVRGEYFSVQTSAIMMQLCVSDAFIPSQDKTFNLVCGPGTLCPGGNVVWAWPLTSIYCRGWKCMKLSLHCTVYLYDMCRHLYLCLPLRVLIIWNKHCVIVPVHVQWNLPETDLQGTAIPPPLQEGSV
jgi:hypothetical protein